MLFWTPSSLFPFHPMLFWMSSKKSLIWSHFTSNAFLDVSGVFPECDTSLTSDAFPDVCISDPGFIPIFPSIAGYSLSPWQISTISYIPSVCLFRIITVIPQDFLNLLPSGILSRSSVLCDIFSHRALCLAFISFHLHFYGQNFGYFYI